MRKPYTNKEYIDWVTEGNLLTETYPEGTALVTTPDKMQIRDVAMTIYGVFDGASVIVEYSPDEMETAAEDLNPAAMRWFGRTDGVFTSPGLTVQSLWENLDAAEGWIRMKITDSTAQTNLAIKTRPRVEKVI